ncbi:hypothetical protein ACFE04_018958 [Oxalis oulophora]
MRCAGCKFLRRKCSADCVLAPYFPPNNPQRFASVHRIFGASNVTKMLRQLPEHLRGDAADCMAFEASLRIADPVYGCVGIISHLQQQIFEVENEIARTRAEIAFQNAQQLVSHASDPNDHHYHNINNINNEDDHNSSWFINGTPQQQEQVGSSLLEQSPPLNIPTLNI